MPTEVVEVYRCENESCPLGSRKDPGHFSGGMTKEGHFLLTGNPEGKKGKDYGESICPSCGTQGTFSHEEEHREGNDPYDDIHQQVAARVADPNDPLTGDESQAVVNQLVAERDPEVEDDDNA